MAICLGPGVGHLTHALLVAVVVTLLVDHGISAAHCRFASNSTSQGSCIFPCRCADGCDTTTGECINGGQCEDGHPSAYRWSGTACQIGNVALNKRTDHNISEQGIAWWTMDLGGLHSISRVIIYNKCKAGYFGFRCRFQCHCRSGETCDDVTGQCPSDCPDDRWGVGCILSNEHYYNDPKGRRYMGKWNRTTHSPSSQPFNVSCKPWSSQTRYGDNLFPDGNRALAKNYCRNLDNYYYTWCVYNSNVNWAGCILTNRRCVTGRYDVNCVKECHCSQVTEDCQVNNGRCQTGCAPHFTGPTCQECEDGYFGVLCYGKCHCRSGSCDKTTGHCPSGCATGWTGDNCETDERVLSTFTLSVGNSSAINDHTQCASHKGQVAARAPINESCAATGRFLSFQRYGGDESHLAALCEVVVIGHRYINCQNCSSASTCNDVIGCDACAKGKQQPDCVNDCEQGNYGINCAENCGRCKVKSECSITDGTCTSGCETWYASPICKTYIAIPQFLSSNKPKVEDIANSSVTVSWTEAENIPSGLEGHYFNLLWLQAEGEAEKIIKRVAQDPGNRQVNSRITGLQFNTKYSIRVKPYRQHNGEQVGGTATGVTRFKTSCIGAGYRTLADNRVGFNNVWLFMTNNSVVTTGDCIEAAFLHHTPKCH